MPCTHYLAIHMTQKHSKNGIRDKKASYHLEQVDSNFITSAYGKENAQDFVRRMAENDKLLYLNKEKSEELALLPLQLRQDHPAPAFDCIIKRMGGGVKDNLRPLRSTNNVFAGFVKAVFESQVSIL